MRISKHVMCWSLVALVSASPAYAQKHVADATAMQNAVDSRVATDRGNRDVVLKALDSTEVQQAAAKMSFNLAQARGAVATMSSDELAQVASAARAVDADRTAGSNTITISVTTLLLVLILIVLIAR